jgi:hypothetical protein
MRVVPLFIIEFMRKTWLVGWQADVERCSCIRYVATTALTLLVQNSYYWEYPIRVAQKNTRFDAE